MSKQNDDTPVPAKTDLNGNDINEIYYTFAKDTAQTINMQLKPPKSVIAALLREMGTPKEIIAQSLEMTVNAVNSALWRVSREPKLKQKFGEALAELTTMYKGSCKTQLPVLAQAESRAALKYLESPELLIDKPALAKQIKQAAGITFGDEQQGTVHVNVGQIMQNILVQARQPAKAIECDVIEGEIAENKHFVDGED